MTSTLVRLHLATELRFLRMLAMSCSTGLTPSPMLANEWIVVPPILHAAMPVDAVTATASVLPRYLRLSEAMISRRRTDLPVPARTVSSHRSPQVLEHGRDA